VWEEGKIGARDFGTPTRTSNFLQIDSLCQSLDAPCLDLERWLSAGAAHRIAFSPAFTSRPCSSPRSSPGRASSGRRSIGTTMPAPSSSPAASRDPAARTTLARHSSSKAGRRSGPGRTSSRTRRRSASWAGAVRSACPRRLSLSHRGGPFRPASGASSLPPHRPRSLRSQTAHPRSAEGSPNFGCPARRV
jgi:hypothetical protein